MKLTAYRYAFLTSLLVVSCQLLAVNPLRFVDLDSGQWSLVIGQSQSEINGNLKGGQWSIVNGHLATLQNDSTLIYSNTKISTGLYPKDKALNSPLTNDLLTDDTVKTFRLYETPLTIDHLKISPLRAIPLTNDYVTNDSIPLTSDVVKRRTQIIAATNIVGYGLGMAWLYHAWYKDYPQSKFHTFNDIGEWKGMDKIGHAYSAYAESKASMELWRWTGIDRKKRIWLGGMSGAFYQTVIEVLDGFSAEWGWSWGDFAANIAGSGLLVAQELAWDEQRVQMKWSFHRKHYAEPMLNNRSNELFGRSSAERFLKDYNGQTYWLSTSLKPFFPDSNLPPWLQISIGTGAEGLFGGFENIGTDKDGNINFQRTDIPRRRQWYLAPDVDLTKIKTNKKGIRLALQVLNIVKFPAPSLEYSGGKFGWNWVSF